MTRLGAVRAAALLLSLAVTDVIMAASETFSTRLDALWDFDAPAKSEARFRAELARHAPGTAEARETTTQIARALGLQRRFDDADAALDALVATLEASSARVRVRYMLERGRIRNSSGRPQDAVRWFSNAVAASADDRQPDADFYRIDALHMLGIAAPEAERLDWNLKALAAADASSDSRARGWRGSLLHNLGWTFHERGDFERALDYWQKALAAREAGGDAKRIQIAKWTVARGLRSLGRLDDAQAIQQSLAIAMEHDGAPDGFVYEELAEIALARNDAAATKRWAAKAYSLLKDDAWIRANDEARLARLGTLGGVAQPSR